MSEISDLEGTVKHLEARLNIAKNELFNAKVEAHEFEIGDILFDKKGKRGEVIRFANNWSKIVPVVQRIKKDGTLGVQTTKCYDWDGWKREEDYPS